MNKSYSKIRHIQETNLKLEQRRFNQLLDSTMGYVRPLVNEQTPPNQPEQRRGHFSIKYFAANPTGTITLSPNQTAPDLLKINGVDVVDKEDFHRMWAGDGPDMGRAFRSGDGNFTYTYEDKGEEGKFINIKGGTCRDGMCSYVWRF